MRAIISWLVAAILLSCAASAQVVPGPPLTATKPGSSISGQLQTPTGGVLANATINFTLSQPAVVSGTSSIAPATVACYTSSAGNVVGVPDPLALPSTSTNTASGTLAAGTYYVKIAFVQNGTVYSLPSPEVSVILTAQGTINVNAPVVQPASASGYAVYIGATSGSETLQGTVTGWTQFQQSSALTNGAAPQTTNNSACNVWFSDSLIPTGTFYTVNLLSQNGSQISGYPQTWCTYGGNGGNINVSQGTPTGSSCGTNGVFYPTPIFASPQGGAAQSIGGPLLVGALNNIITLGGSPTYPCSVTGLQAALLAVSGGGTVDGRGCLGIIPSQITNVTGGIVQSAFITVLLGPSTWTCTITTAGVPCWQISGSGAKLLGAGAGNFGQGADPAIGAALGATNFLCSSCGTTTDMVRVFSSSRGTLAAAIIDNPEVGGLWINMGGSGRRPVYTTTVDAGYFHDIEAYNFVDHGFDLEGMLATDPAGYQSYKNILQHILMQPQAANTTGDAVRIDASNAEVSWTTLSQVRGSGNKTTGGGASGLRLLVRPGPFSTSTLQHTTILSSYFGNSSTSAANGGYGAVLDTNGTGPAAVPGMINNLMIADTLIERIFSAASGVGLEGLNNGSASGTGIAGFRFLGCVSANWGTSIDRANLGAMFSEMSDCTTLAAGSGTFWANGTINGNNSSAFNDSAQHVAQANSDLLLGFLENGTWNDNGKSSLSAIGASPCPTLAGGATGSNFSTAYCLNLSDPSFGGTKAAANFNNGTILGLGKLNLTNLLFSSAAPTISPSTGFNTGSIASTPNGNAEFFVTVGSGTANSTGTIGLPTAATAWHCTAENQTRADFITQSANTTASVTLQNWGTTFAATNWTNGDTLLVRCGAH